MSEDFKTEEFENVQSVKDKPLEEGEPSVGVILASNRIPVRYYENMTIQMALDQCHGSPEGEKFRLLLDGSVASLDTVIPNSDAEVIFVGNWTLGNKKKIN